MSLLIVASVILVDFYLVSLIYFWGMTLNMFTGINMVISMGLAVDYSAHIAHKFMLIEPKDDDVARDAKKLRQYKAQKALSKIGASVFHAAFSSLLALSVLGWAKSYHFQVGFRIWVGIISFGFFTGFFLMPVMLSWVGPVVTKKEDQVEVANAKLTEVLKTVSVRKMKVAKKVGIDPFSTDGTRHETNFVSRPSAITASSDSPRIVADFKRD